MTYVTTRKRTGLAGEAAGWLLVFLLSFFFGSSETIWACEKTILSKDGIPICYADEGSGDPNLVFVHGWCCEKEYWKKQTAFFSKTHRVVAVDLAGHGDSGLGRKDWTMAAFGRDVVSVVEALDLKRTVLVGHSMGGPVILEASKRMPERVLALVGADTFQDFEAEYRKEDAEAFVAPFRADFVDATKNHVRRMFRPGADPTLVEYVVKGMSSAPPEMAVPALAQLIGYDYGKSVANIAAPVYTINSDRWPTNVAANRLHDPDFKIRYMGGVGHFVMLEDPATFNRLLAQVLEELTGR